MLDALLELPAVGVGLACLDLRELGLGRLELGLGTRGVDLVHVDRVVHQRERAVLLDLEEPGAGRELADLRPALDVDAGGARLQQRDERRVAREHADLPGGAGDDQHLGLALVGGAVRRDQRDLENGHQAAAGSASRPAATASSIVPTM